LELERVPSQQANSIGYPTRWDITRNSIWLISAISSLTGVNTHDDKILDRFDRIHMLRDGILVETREKESAASKG